MENVNSWKVQVAFHTILEEIWEQCKELNEEEIENLYERLENHTKMEKLLNESLQKSE